MTIADPLEQVVGDGFVNKIAWDQWRDLAADWADAIIFDSEGYGEDANALRPLTMMVGHSCIASPCT
jgi:hypothetical protein